MDTDRSDRPPAGTSGTHPHARWRTGIVLAAVVALVVATIVTVAALRDRAMVAVPVGPATGAPTAGRPAVVPELDCARAGAEVSAPPSGTVVVRLCDASGDQLVGRVPPPDQLTTDVAGLIGLFRSLPVSHPRTQACTAELSATYAMVFGVPGKPPVHVTGELYGCRVVGSRLGADKLLVGFAERLRTQRALSPAPDVRLAPDCSKPSLAYVPPALTAITQGWLCYRTHNEQTDRVIPLSAADIAAIRMDLVAHAGPDEPPMAPCPSDPQLALVLADGFGAPVALQGFCLSHWALPHPNPDLTVDQWWWTPTAPVAKMLAARQRN